MKKTFLLFVLCCLTRALLNAQQPANDATYQTIFLDDFNTPLNNLIWCSNYCWGPIMNKGDSSYAVSSNAYTQNGYLNLKCEQLSTPIRYNNRNYYFQTGAVSLRNQYKYGYYEISAMYPKGRGFWPGFWLFGTNSSTYYGEIDIGENGGDQSVTGQIMGHNMHWRDATYPSGPTQPYWDLAGSGLVPVGLPVNDITLEHKYAVLWEPNKVTWFYDDVQVDVFNDNVTVNGNTFNPVPKNPASLILDLAVSNWVGGEIDATTPLPSYFKINYVKISQLRKACAVIENICTFNPSTYNYAVKKSISIAGGACSSTINTSSNVTLWATDFVLLDEGAYINADGSGSFLANVTDCPN